MKLRTFATAGITAISLAAPLSAADIAIILSNVKYRTQKSLPSGPGVDRIQRALADAGFKTFTMKNNGMNTAAFKLSTLSDQIEEADRLVVVVNGHVVSSFGASYLLDGRAERPSAYSVGTMGLPLAPLMAAAGDKQGAAVFAVIDQGREARVSDGVASGFDANMIPQGVTVLSGNVSDMADLFETGLLDGAQSMKASLDDNPDISGAGFVSSTQSLMPAKVADVRVVEEVEPVVELTPEEKMALVEEAMELTRDERRSFQQSLAVLGYDPRGIDGLIGPGSRRALRSYQADRDLEPTGYLTESVLARLLDEAAVRNAELEEEALKKQLEAEARDTAYWRSTGRGTDEDGMRAYLRRYPDGLFAEVAQGRLEAIEEARRPNISQREQRFWDRAVEANSAEGYSDYLERFPEGAYRTNAETALQAIADAELQAQAEKKYAAEERTVAGNSVARRLVENRLRSLGLDPGQVDGTFTEETRSALRRFQQARGLPVTGYVNQATMVRILVGN